MNWVGIEAIIGHLRMPIFSQHEVFSEDSLIIKKGGSILFAEKGSKVLTIYT